MCIIRIYVLKTSVNVSYKSPLQSSQRPWLWDFYFVLVGIGPLTFTRKLHRLSLFCCRSCCSAQLRVGFLSHRGKYVHVISILLNRTFKIFSVHKPLDESGFVKLYLTRRVVARAMRELVVKVAGMFWKNRPFCKQSQGFEIISWTPTRN